MTTTPSWRVMVVDDSATIRRSAEIFLQQAGHTVVLAEDGFDALAKIHDQAPQLVFCDTQMPRLDGYQTCTILRRHTRFATLPFVLLSATDGVFERARAQLAGAQDLLGKPFTKDQLLQALQQFARPQEPA